MALFVSRFKAAAQPMLGAFLVLSITGVLRAQEPAPSPTPTPTPSPTIETPTPTPPAPTAPAPTSNPPTEPSANPSIPNIPKPVSQSPVSVEIDLSVQKARLKREGKIVIETPVSTGRIGFETPAGPFSVTQKDREHKSSLYGKILDKKGRVLVSDADSKMPVPSGAKFVAAPMRHFLRFNGAIGMHAGRLPGYPASHGCVRLPAGKAAAFFDTVELGTPVRVVGKTPAGGPRGKARATDQVKAATPLPAPATPKPFRWFPWFRAKS
jgi:lipoprotein-anchoring transpeptidase ErfK/SrfK